MSEYLSVYLREKKTPILQYREYPHGEAVEGKSKEEIQALYNECEEYNRKVEESYGCELFYLTTTPSRQLDVVPWTDKPKALTKDLLAEVLAFYKEEIEESKKYRQQQIERIEQLEARIVKASPELYDKIDQEICEARGSISWCDEEIEEQQYYLQKFQFVNGIIRDDSNAERYELIYTKC